MFFFNIFAFIPRKWGQLLEYFHLHIIDHVFIYSTRPPISSLIIPIKFFIGLHLNCPLLSFRPDFLDYLVINFSIYLIVYSLLFFRLRLLFLYSSSYTIDPNSIRPKRTTLSSDHFHFNNFHFYFFVLIQRPTLRVIHHCLSPISFLNDTYDETFKILSVYFFAL